MRLSLCVAAYNEEKNIHYPLDSALDLVDEVIIVDGGSSDKTVRIADSYGPKVKVFKEKFEPMFHLNKQKAIQRASGEWILQLDADEALSEGLKKEIVNLLKTFKKIKHQQKSSVVEETVAYWIPRKNFFLNRFLMKGGQYPDYTIRLYRNGCARFPCQSIHENVQVYGKVGYLQNPILHYADLDFSRYLMRWDRYSTLEAQQLVAKIRHQASRYNLSLMFFDYFFIKPTVWFFRTYFRHLGFLDGFAGFVFALFSSIRFWVIYIKIMGRLCHDYKQG